MKNSLFQLALAGVCLALVAGCQKKETPAAEAPPAPEKPPQTEIKVPPQAPVASAPTPAEPAAPVVASAAENGPDKVAYEAWFKKYHLDLSDPKMLDADPDNDGFTNREEFLANTDPLDPNSHPPYSDPSRHMRLKEYSEARLPLTVDKIEGDKAHLKRTDSEGKVETVKAGDTVHGLPLKVLKIDARKDIDKNGEPVDLSQVTLEDSTTKEKYVLVGNRPAKTSASFAVLVNRDGKGTLKVHVNDVFTWPGEGGLNYKVIDMSQDQVVLQQMDNNQMWTVPRPNVDAESNAAAPPAPSGEK